MTHVVLLALVSSQRSHRVAEANYEAIIRSIPGFTYLLQAIANDRRE